MSEERNQPAAPVRVDVRMYRALGKSPDKAKPYRGLLGDCFLIRIEDAEGNRSRILIDCGMLLGSPEADARMHDIAADIVAECGGDLAGKRPGRLDLLVVTHEHWDHISGFSQAQDIFFDPRKLVIENLWMAWTEDPANEQAKALRKRFDKSGAAFAMIATRLRKERLPDGSLRFGDNAAERTLHGLDGFIGLAADAPASDGGSEAGTRKPRPAFLAGREIMEKLKHSVGPEADRRAPDYLKPGRVLPTPGAVSLPAFVLGPPTDEKRLFKDKPSAKGQETYFDTPTIDGAQMLKFGAGEDPDPSSDSPFAPPYCRFLAKDFEKRIAEGKQPRDATGQFLHDRYYGPADLTPCAREALERRRIDTDWLGAAGTLALKLDSDTNNTSLVLAFELPDETLMLFAADAQVGNWLSWHDQPYGIDKDGNPITAEMLLNRTRLYKVGHHGSHNATLDALGLAMMTRSDLVALIPTDEEFGKRQGSGWQMPNPRVNVALREKTQGRILRNDRIYWLDAPEKRAADPELRQVRDPGFFDRLTETDLYLEYRML